MTSFRSFVPALAIVAAAVTVTLLTSGTLLNVADVTGRLAPLALLTALHGAAVRFWPRASAGLSLLLAVVISGVLLMPYAENFWHGPAAIFNLARASILVFAWLWFMRRGTTRVPGFLALNLLAAVLVFNAGCLIFALHFAGMAAILSLVLVLQFFGKGIPMQRIADVAPYYASTLVAALAYGGLGKWAGIVLVALPLIACSGLKPSGGRHHPEVPEIMASVQFSLTPESMELLTSDQATKLRIRIFKVEDDKTGAQEGDDQLFDLQPGQSSYQLTNVRLGMKEFDLTVLNANAEDMGDGSARYLVKPGAQTLPPITIKLHPADKVRRDVNATVFVQMTAPGQAAKTTYLDVKPIIHDHCISCHDALPREQRGGLDLSDFEFKLSTRVVTQEQLVKEMISAMKDPTEPMPPIPEPPKPRDKMKPEQIAVFQKWLSDGVAKFPDGGDDTKDLARKVQIKWKATDGDEHGDLTVDRSSDPAHPFAATLKGLAVKGKYDLDFAVIATDGSVTYETQVAGFIVADAGDLEKTLTVPYQDPQVTVPVVINQ